MCERGEGCTNGTAHRTRWSIHGLEQETKSPVLVCLYVRAKTKGAIEKHVRNEQTTRRADYAHHQSEQRTNGMPIAVALSDPARGCQRRGMGRLAFLEGNTKGL